MPFLRIPPHIGLCEVDGRILMLDLRRDRYFELDPASAEALLHWRKTRAPDAGDPRLQRLVERGIFVPSERPDGSGWTERPAPRRSLLDLLPTVANAWRFAPEAAVHIWRARRRIGRGLEKAVARASQTRPDMKSADPGPALSRFAAARRLVPVAPNCLLDSLALAAFLAKRGIGCELVFGVKLDPFAAHCWLQIGDAVANDAADSVATFTPILVA